MIYYRLSYLQHEMDQIIQVMNRDQVAGRFLLPDYEVQIRPSVPLASLTLAPFLDWQKLVLRFVIFQFDKPVVRKC